MKLSVIGAVILATVPLGTIASIGSPPKPNASSMPVTIPAYWAKAIRVAETREDLFMRGCDGSLGTYTAKVWADKKYYYVRFDGLPGSNKPYHPSFTEDVISRDTFAIIRHSAGNETYE